MWLVDANNVINEHYNFFFVIYDTSFYKGYVISHVLIISS